MKQICTTLVLVTTLACSSARKNSNNNDSLNGTWIPIRQEIGGNSIPVTAMQGQMLVLKDSTYTFTAESIDKGVARYSNTKMDIYGKEGVNKGKHFTAIYKLEHQELSICYNLAGDGYPDTFDTKGHSTYFLCVFRPAK